MSFAPRYATLKSGGFGRDGHLWSARVGTKATFLARRPQRRHQELSVAGGTEAFPLTEIPLAEMIARAEAGRYRAKPVQVFGFDQIVQAHRAMEEGTAGGKMVVAVS
jgi:NADPH:quinone reductase-like Zn-dependent oxidoreductase